MFTGSIDSPFMTPTYILISAAFYALWAFFEWAERKSKRWYRDRMMLRAAGYCFALGNVFTGLAIAE